MAIKKSELYSSLWASCDELRGGMDASQYKDYVLVLLFIKYVSDKYADQPFAPIQVPPGAGFSDMVALKGQPDIGDRINKEIIAPLEKANRITIKTDFNDPALLGSGREMVDRLGNLIAIFQNPALDFSRNRADGDDILGDAYEYLMRHFATESGKSKGQFYTPAEVSRIMAKIIGIGAAGTTSTTTVYDPTCGSGSLLLKVGDEAHADVTLYGQEKDEATSGLARMNMILHNKPGAVIEHGNTLTTPRFKDGEALKTFDYVVANPPFSDKRWSTGLNPLNDPFDRFQTFGAPPAKQGDYAYLLHIVRSLKSTGKGACILPHGVLFRGNAEAEIRKKLVQRGYIKGIVGLPANLFYGTGIPACIVVIDKAEAAGRKGIFMVDASAGYMKDGPKNRLRERDIHRIVDVFTRQDDSDPGYARLVSFAEIEKNDYNLNLPRYLDSARREDRQDIAAHLQGGIPAADVDALADYWAVCPKLKATLFRSAGFQPAFQLADKGWHTRGYLPHLDTSNQLQFVTFRLADAMPAEQIELWKQELNWHDDLAADSPESIALRKKIEHYADAGHGACHLRDPHIARLVQDALLHFDGQRYRLMAWCIMPNHVHVVLEPTDAAHPLSSIIHSWKSFTATEANKLLGRTGAFWMPDYFDRYIRDDAHLHATLDYIRQNPIKAGLVQRPEDWPWMGARASSPHGGQDGRAPERAPYLDLAVEKPAIKPTIHHHPEFAAFIAGIDAHFAAWRKQAAEKLKALTPGFHPKTLIEDLSEGLLQHFTGQPLLDPYALYQQLMDYWDETMRDDAYLITEDGWQARPYRLIEKDKKGREKDKGWACDLVPKATLVARYFADEQARIDRLAADLEAAGASLAELEEEHGGAEDETGAAFSGFDKITAAAVKDRIREILGTRASSPQCGQDGRAPDDAPEDDPDEQELATLKRWLELTADEAALKKRLKDAEAALDAAAYAHYPKLTEAEIKALAVDDRWLAALDRALHSEMERISQALAQRVKELAERYETPLPKLAERVEELQAKVNRHLERMGFSWH